MPYAEWEVSEMHNFSTLDSSRFAQSVLHPLDHKLSKGSPCSCFPLDPCSQQDAENTDVHLEGLIFYLWT